MSESERGEVVDVVAANPKAGIDLGGGVRKLRVGTAGRGKRGSARVVYLFGGEHMPVFLVAAFAKNVRSDFQRREVRALKDMVKEIRSAYGRPR